MILYCFTNGTPDRIRATFSENNNGVFVCSERNYPPEEKIEKDHILALLKDMTETENLKVEKLKHECKDQCKSLIFFKMICNLCCFTKFDWFGYTLRCAMSLKIVLSNITFNCTVIFVTLIVRLLSTYTFKR